MLDALVARAEDAPPSALPCDVTDSDAVRDAVANGEAALGGPFDLAVANAGVGIAFPASKFDLAAAEQMVNVNVLGMLFSSTRWCRRWSSGARGISPAWPRSPACAGCPTSAVYSATKAAMQAFLEATRVELAPLRRRRDHHQSRLRRHADDGEEQVQDAVPHDRGATRRASSPTAWSAARAW